MNCRHSELIARLDRPSNLRSGRWRFLVIHLRRKRALMGRSRLDDLTTTNT